MNVLYLLNRIRPLIFSVSSAATVEDPTVLGSPPSYLRVLTLGIVQTTSAIVFSDYLLWELMTYSGSRKELSVEHSLG